MCNCLMVTLSMFFLLFLGIMVMYPILWSSWGGNSILSSLSTMRSLSQMMSYDIIFVFLVMMFMMFNQSMEMMMQFSSSSMSTFFLNFMLFSLWYCTLLAEMNRTPFDLIESESELVSGYNTEYSSGSFTLLFMSEYMCIWFNICIITMLFMMNNNLNLLITVLSTIFVLYSIIVRATLPRMKYSEIIDLMWKLLVFVVFFFVLVLIIV